MMAPWYFLCKDQLKYVLRNNYESYTVTLLFPKEEKMETLETF